MYIKRLTPADIRQRAENIEQNAAMVRGEVEKIQSMLKNLQASDSGNYNRVQNNLEGDQASIRQWEQIVRSFAEELRTVAMRMEISENR